VCEFVLSLDEWLAPNFAASSEAQKYTRAYAQKMGLATGSATSSRDIAERAQSMFGRYKGIWTQIASKTKDMKGYPVKTTFAFAVGGPQCQSAQQQQSSSSPPPASSGDSTQSPPTNPAAVAAQISGKISGLFHKKSDSAPPADASAGADASAPAAAAPAAPMPDGMVPVITMTSELVSVSTAAVDPSVFEVPADFKKVQR
jgi:hypothetical protein